MRVESGSAASGSSVPPVRPPVPPGPAAPSPSASPASSAGPRWSAVTSTASSSPSRRTNTDPRSPYAKASRAAFQFALSRSSPVSRSDSGSLPSASASRKSSYSVPSRRVYDVFVRVAVEYVT